jgi:hypothetical protein
MKAPAVSGNYTQLIETWRMQWVLLQLAVQLDQGGVKREVATLGELRKHLLEQIIETGSTIANSANTRPLCWPVTAAPARSGADSPNMRSRTAPAG